MPANAPESIAVSSAKFLRQFSQLADRLAELDIITIDANLSFGCFGCWSFVARKRFEEVKVSFDGKDEFLCIKTSPIDQHTSARNWTTVVQRPCASATAISVAEDIIRRRYPIAPKPPGAH